MLSTALDKMEKIAESSKPKISHEPVKEEGGQVYIIDGKKYRTNVKTDANKKIEKMDPFEEKLDVNESKKIAESSKPKTSQEPVKEEVVKNMLPTALKMEQIAESSKPKISQEPVKEEGGQVYYIDGKKYKTEINESKKIAESSKPKTSQEPVKEEGVTNMLPTAPDKMEQIAESSKPKTTQEPVKKEEGQVYFVDGIKYRTEINESKKIAESFKPKTSQEPVKEEEGQVYFVDGIKYRIDVKMDANKKIEKRDPFEEKFDALRKALELLGWCVVELNLITIL